MNLNSIVLNWPNNIAPIFDQNDEVNVKVFPIKIRELTLCKNVIDLWSRWWWEISKINIAGVPNPKALTSPKNGIGSKDLAYFQCYE